MRDRDRAPKSAENGSLLQFPARERRDTLSQPPRLSRYSWHGKLLILSAKMVGWGTWILTKTSGVRVRVEANLFR